MFLRNLLLNSRNGEWSWLHMITQQKITNTYFGTKSEMLL